MFDNCESAFCSRPQRLPNQIDFSLRYYESLLAYHLIPMDLTTFSTPIC